MEAKSSSKVSRTAVDAPPECVRLRRLGLRPAELGQLKRQGYVGRRIDESGRVYWRLRFRAEGVLRTIYLGKDDAFVAEVKGELAELRAARLKSLRLRKTVDGEKQKLRGWKRRTAELLAPHGYFFHGDALRKARRGN